MGGIQLGVQPRPHWRPPTQCDRGGADTDRNTHSHEYSKNILEQTQETNTQFYSTLSEIVVLNYQEELINCVQACKETQSVAAAFKR